MKSRPNCPQSEPHHPVCDRIGWHGSARSPEGYRLATTPDRAGVGAPTVPPDDPVSLPSPRGVRDAEREVGLG